ncbi:response regulator [Lysinibacillus sp. LZ02]|uniref:response regulator n=1 Tax=Lysinibacillus sp. LZ02 TaxID=3420668 RepID=UPI003D368971
MQNILIIDDQPGIRLLLNEVFKKEGYITYLAQNGIEALKIFDEEAIDCVLLDMKIPGMNGIEILQQLKAKNEAIPVMMMTAYGEQDLIDEAMRLGATKYFTKPFNIFDVLNSVKDVLSV